MNLGKIYPCVHLPFYHIIVRFLPPTPVLANPDLLSVTKTLPFLVTSYASLYLPSLI